LNLYGNTFKIKRDRAIGMERQMENIRKIAIILAPDHKGLQRVFGLPAVRRLTILALRLGMEEIHTLGQVKALEPVLSDLIPPERLQPAEEPSCFEGIVESLGLADQQRVLVLKANHVIDRSSLARLIEAGDRSIVYFIEVNGKEGLERLYSTPPPYLALILRHLWSPSSNLSLPDKAQPVQGTDGLPYVLGGGGEGIKIAEDRLMKALASQMAGEDGFLARHVSRRLVLTPVTPNQITLGGGGHRDDRCPDSCLGELLAAAHRFTLLFSVPLWRGYMERSPV